MSVLKGIYVVAKNMEADKEQDPGVYKKIQAQLKAFRKVCDVQLIEAYWKNTTIKKILSRLPGFPNLFFFKWKSIDWRDIDFVYFRLNLGDAFVIRFLKYVKSINPNCKIIVELPDYPVNWRAFLRKWHQQFFVRKHDNCTKRLYRYVDRIVVFNEYDEIYGIKTIVTENGVDVDLVSLRDVSENTNDINVISVSTMLNWQGIDRFIVGMGEYYKDYSNNRNIKLHLVGQGRSQEQYKSLVTQYGLENRVLFYGFKNGKELDDIYSKCDLGLAEIGRHRVQKEQKRSTSIKVREYWAKGLPVICACAFDETTEQKIGKYIYKINSDEQPVDISLLIEFYDSVYLLAVESKVKIAKEIREFAVCFCSTDTVMKPIIDYIIKE